MGNPKDPDYDPKGYRNGERGRSKKPDLAQMIGDGWDKEPTQTDYNMAAQGLGLKPREVPRFDTVAELQVWVFRMNGLRGSKEHFQELGDRAAPKPSRTTAGGAGVSSRGPTGKSRTAAERWFAELDGGADEEEDDADLM